MSEKSERDAEKNNTLKQLINHAPLLGGVANAAISSTLSMFSLKEY